MNRKLRVTSLALLSIIIMVSFQNCNNDVDFGMKDEISAKANAANSFLINNGAQFTNKLDVTLNLESKNALRVAVYQGNNCQGEPEYRDYDSELIWTLGDDNNNVQVSVRFESLKGTQSGVRLSECISDSIVHDGLAPLLKVESGPARFTNQADSDIEMSLEEKGSGLKNLECLLNDELMDDCSELISLRGLSETPHNFKVRATDRAGNVSEWTTWNWSIDQTPPVVSVSSGPAALTNVAAARIAFSASDDKSGIAGFKCKWSDQTEYKSCKDVIARGDLREGVQNVIIVARDNAGNLSEPLAYRWEIDTLPPGQFQILGVEGGPGSNDRRVDSWFSGEDTVLVSWSRATDSIRYNGSILDDQTEMCSFQTQDISTSVNDCNLDSNKDYKLMISATDRVGNVTNQMLDFTVDRDGPSISFSEPVVDNEEMTAKLNFTAQDNYALDTLMCRISNDDNYLRELDCESGKEIMLEGLAKGVYTFAVSATDKAGNSSMRSQQVEVVPIVCNPFVQTEEKCEKGLKGNIYYLTNEQRGRYKRVDDYIEFGTKVEATVYFNQLAIPTLSWTLGFETDRGATIRGNQGQKLFEYFALDIESILKLSDDDSEGYYQFAVLSDDGSVVTYLNEDGETATLINNDGNHPTRMGCSDQILQLDKDSRIPIRVKYYQGPRNHISLTMMWRKVEDPSNVMRDELCGQQGNSKYFGSKDSYKSPDYENYKYADLVERGWKTIAPANFVLDEEAAPQTPMN